MAERFVEEKDAKRAGEGTADRKSLLLASGKGFDGGVEAVGDSEPFGEADGTGDGDGVESKVGGGGQTADEKVVLQNEGNEV